MNGTQVFVNGRLLVTTAQAAADRGITVAGMRKVLSQNGIEPVAELDGRTPLYDPVDLARLNPPGRGVYRRSAP
jgi:hypothetical protein